MRRIGIVWLVIFWSTVSVMAQIENEGKTGILMVHYGTNHDGSRKETIDKLNEMVAERFADCKVVEAYAASSVLKSLGKRGIHKQTIREALDSLRNSGCTRLVVQSTMLLDGVMTDLMKEEVMRVKGYFHKVSLGRPLLYSVEDCRTVVALLEHYLLDKKNWNAAGTQVVLIGHGSDNPANAVYSQIDYLVKEEGKTNWHVGTIEGFPTIESVKRQLDRQKQKCVVLVPLLYIAGNHQREDIDGVWREALIRHGYKVNVVDEGLGNMPEIQEMIMDRIQNMIKQ